ncbi:MAG TPA: cytochrome P450 [Burkholderiales bacterium]
MTGPSARPVPVRIEPPTRPLGRLAFIARFVRNPLSVIPHAAYEEDAVPAAQGARRFLWVTAPALVKAVLLEQQAQFRKQSQIRLLSPLLGRGVLTSEGADWKWQRQAAAPLFRQQDVMGFVPVFVRAAQAVVAGWRRSPPGTVQRVDADMTRGTFAVISATLLPSADDTVGPAVERSTGRFQRLGAWPQLYALANLPRWLPQPGRLALLDTVRALRGAVAGVVRERRESGAAPDDLLQRLMQARDPDSGRAMNDEQLVDNLLTFYLAGHETTAKALTWTLYLLSRSPEWTAALAAEIATVTGGAPVAAAHVERLVRVQQVLKESMRLYPPVPLMTRQAAEDTTLGGIRVPRGTSVVMPIYAIHRHRRRWPEPDAFDPKRFSLAAESAMPRYQYLPFGAGPRICIGMAFAMVEATVMLATLLQQARFVPAGGAEPMPVARVTLVPRGGLRLRVEFESA